MPHRFAVESRCGDRAVLLPICCQIMADRSQPDGCRPRTLKLAPVLYAPPVADETQGQAPSSAASKPATAKQQTRPKAGPISVSDKVHGVWISRSVQELDAHQTRNKQSDIFLPEVPKATPHRNSRHCLSLRPDRHGRGHGTRVRAIHPLSPSQAEVLTVRKTCNRPSANNPFSSACLLGRENPQSMYIGFCCGSICHKGNPVSSGVICRCRIMQPTPL